MYLHTTSGFPGGASGKEPTCRSCRRRRFDPCVGEIPWRRAGQPTLVFLPGESHGQRSLVGYSPWGRKESDTTEAGMHTHTWSSHQYHIITIIIPPPPSCHRLHLTSPPREGLESKLEVSWNKKFCFQTAETTLAWLSALPACPTHFKTHSHVSQFLKVYLFIYQYWYWPGEGNGNPLQYSCLGNPMDRV